jgi:hypothetical protein
MDLYTNKNIFTSKVKCIKISKQSEEKTKEKMDTILDKDFIKTYYKNK